MPQTILALLAIVLVSILTLSWKQTNVETQVGAIRTELQVQARGVATEVFETMATVRFDGAATLNDVPYTSASQLSQVQSFGGRACDTAINGDADVDDYNGAACSVTRELTDPDSGDLVPVTFAVNVAVSYVKEVSGQWVPTNPSVDPNNGRTFAKRATLTLRTPLDDGRAPIVLSRVYAYDPSQEPID